jgi:PTS system mannose-specific IIA component
MIGILIIAHNSLGASLLDCAKHVLGEQPQKLEFLAVNHDDDQSSLLPEALALIRSLDSGKGVLVLSDIYGATPCNVVRGLLQPGLVEGIAGVNLPMLIRALSYRNEPLRVVVEKAISGGREGVVHFDQETCERYESKVE